MNSFMDEPARLLLHHLVDTCFFHVIVSSECAPYCTAFDAVKSLKWVNQSIKHANPLS